MLDTGPVRGPTLADLANAYRDGRTTVREVVTQTLARIDARGDDGTWITRADPQALLARADALDAADERWLPLFGVPFAVKDSIDVVGMPTTLACPEYAYRPAQSAPAVERLLDAGALCVGKTNLDQFATGLNGTRTPYGPPLHSVYGPDLISGGSSSGSALAVALGLVPFAVATDTAGSGRVPAALNGILGYKPSRGLISTVGLVPACRSLDCMSLMATTVDDLRRVMDVVAAVDDRDPYARPRSTQRALHPRIGLPDPSSLPFGHVARTGPFRAENGDPPHRGDLGDDASLRAAHDAACAHLDTLGSVVEVPVEPFLAAGQLLYDGPWVAERTLEFGDFLAEHPDAVLPVVARIIDGGRTYSAVDVFAAQYRLAELAAEVARLWEQVDVVVLPTVPTTFSPAQVLADPVATNTSLGQYTHCGNLLDLCALVVPAPPTSDGRPVGLMVLGPALADESVLAVGARLTEVLQHTTHPALEPA